MENNQIIYGLEFQARALASLQAESEIVKFFAATQSLKPSNQIHCIELTEGEIGAYKTQIFKHDLGEVWKLNASPFDSQLLASVYSCYKDSALVMGTALLRIPQNTTSQELAFEDVNEVLRIDSGEMIKTTEFNPVDEKILATVVDGRLLISDLETFRCVAEVAQNKAAPKFTGGKWSQHSAASQFICLHDSAVRAYDIRQGGSSAVWCIEEAHGQQLVRDLDCNPNRQCHLATAGDDGAIRIWDSRSVRQPVWSRSDHHHWVFSVRFNTFHDSLLLSSASDLKVNLTCARSVSSEAETAEKEPLADGLLQVFEPHEDSVYAAEWSSADPWIFASLSYDGRLVISQVPKQYKFQLLM